MRQILYWSQFLRQQRRTARNSQSNQERPTTYVNVAHHLLAGGIVITPLSPSIFIVVSNAAERLRTPSRSCCALEPCMRKG